MKHGRLIEELIDFAASVAASKKDYVAPASKFRVESTGDVAGVMASVGNGPLRIRKIAHDQIAAFADIPKGYYDRMFHNDPTLLATNVNAWLGRSTAKRLVRTLDGDVRAFLSDRYRPLDNLDLLDGVVPVLREHVDYTVESCEATETRLYLQAVRRNLSAEIRPGDIVSAGVVVSNSEVGHGALRVEPLVFRLICSNGAIVRDLGAKKYHVGRGTSGDDGAPVEWLRDETRAAEDKAFLMKVQDVVRGAIGEAGFKVVVDRLRTAAGREIPGDVVAVTEIVAARSGLSEDERGQVLKNLLKSSDPTQYGLANAVTAIANDTEDYDRVIELERAGGWLATMPANEWQNLVAVN